MAQTMSDTLLHRMRIETGLKKTGLKMNYIIFTVAMIVSVVYGQGPKFPNDCQYGSLGRCNMMSGNTCPTGSTCKITWFPVRFSCCRDKPVEETCPNGQNGICGGIAGFTCPFGTTCRFMQNFPDAAGKCCIDKPVDEQCEHGQSGMCGGIAGLKCKEGFTCQFTPTNIFDGMGKCCRVKPVIKGVCPPPSGMAGICVFDPERNCLGDEFCPSGQLCCSEGCGRVCKPALPSIPIPTGPVPY